jgi:phage baseplate assembly protein W
MSGDPVRDAAYRLAYGRGLAAPEVMPGTDIGSDLRFEAGPNGTRLAEVSGVDNLAQGLRLALTTAFGASPFDGGYGFDGLGALATESDPRMQRERIRIAVAQTVQRDPRVLRVTDVQAAPDAPSRTLAVEVAFDTTASQGQTVTIGGLPGGN